MTVSAPNYRDMRWNAEENHWEQAKKVIGSTRVLAGPQLSQQLLEAPEHLAMVLARYRAAAALIGDARVVAEFGSGEGLGARILARGRQRYCGIDADHDAIMVARQTVGNDVIGFAEMDLLAVPFLTGTVYDAVVSLDVIEHIPSTREDDFLRAAVNALPTFGTCAIGTPSKNAEHLASPQSRAGHINLYTPDRLKALMARHFHVVQEFGMQATEISLGHASMRHYLLVCGIGPRRSGVN